MASLLYVLFVILQLKIQAKIHSPSRVVFCLIPPCYTHMAATTPPLSTSGIMSCTNAVTGTLSLTLATNMGLALDGQEVLTLDLLKTGRLSVCAYEALLRSLGYRLDLVAQNPQPDLRNLPHDGAGYELLLKNIPREIPLTEVSRDRVVKQFRALAMVRRHRYADPLTMSLGKLSERVAAIAIAPPLSFPVSHVRRALDVVPLLLAAHQGLAVYHLPLLCGYSSPIMTRFAKGGVEPSIDRHVTLLVHLGLDLRLSGPAGEITVSPTIHSLASCLKASETFRQLRSESTQQAPPRTRKRRKVTGESSMSIDDICKRLAAGDSPRDIAKAAGVSHQRIYFIAKQAGLGVRQRKAKISSRMIMVMPKPPTE